MGGSGRLVAGVSGSSSPNGASETSHQGLAPAIHVLPAPVLACSPHLIYSTHENNASKHA